MKPASKEQIKAVNATLAKAGLMDDKASIIKQVTNGRTEHSSELYFEEAKSMLMGLLKNTWKQQPKNKMISKIFAMAHEMGWVEKRTEVGKDGNLIKVNDYNRVYGWIKKYGYLNPKDLKEYEYKEIPKLVAQFENGPYKHYLSNL